MERNKCLPHWASSSSRVLFTCVAALSILLNGIMMASKLAIELHREYIIVLSLLYHLIPLMIFLATIFHKHAQCCIHKHHQPTSHSIKEDDAGLKLLKKVFKNNAHRYLIVK